MEVLVHRALGPGLHHLRFYHPPVSMHGPSWLPFQTASWWWASFLKKTRHVGTGICKVKWTNFRAMHFLSIVLFFKPLFANYYAFQNFVSLLRHLAPSFRFLPSTASPISAPFAPLPFQISLNYSIFPHPVFVPGPLLSVSLQSLALTSAHMQYFTDEQSRLSDGSKKVSPKGKHKTFCCCCNRAGLYSFCAFVLHTGIFSFLL